jgi:carboxymethylenebutenolidase
MGSYTNLVMQDGATMRAYQAMPASGQGPVVVVLQEIFGVNEAIRSVANDLALNGYIALAPDLFWRLEPGVELAYDAAGREKAFAYWKSFDLETGVTDVIAAISAAREPPFGSGKVGVLGFCLGGQLAVEAGARAGVDAVVCFYGVRLGESLDEIAGLVCPTLFHFGDADAHIPAEVRRMVTDLADRSPDMKVEIYAGAEHGFYNSFRLAGFNPSAYELSRRSTLELLHRALGEDLV